MTDETIAEPIRVTVRTRRRMNGSRCPSEDGRAAVGWRAVSRLESLKRRSFL